MEENILLFYLCKVKCLVARFKSNGLSSFGVQFPELKLRGLDLCKEIDVINAVRAFQEQDYCKLDEVDKGCVNQGSFFMRFGMGYRVQSGSAKIPFPDSQAPLRRNCSQKSTSSSYRQLGKTN